MERTKLPVHAVYTHTNYWCSGSSLDFIAEVLRSNLDPVTGFHNPVVPLSSSVFLAIFFKIVYDFLFAYLFIFICSLFNDAFK
jgi:hypothetical protein